jgi:predicted nuclease of predicted toxin-antitoxin system
MGISPRSVALLREQGHDAIHLHDLGLDRLPDCDVMALARAEGRIVLTHDLDFADLIAASGETLPSVVIFCLRSMRAQRVNDYLRVLLTQHAATLSSGAVVSVSESQMRVRPLPL